MKNQSNGNKLVVTEDFFLIKINFQKIRIITLMSPAPNATEKPIVYCWLRRENMSVIETCMDFNVTSYHCYREINFSCWTRQLL